jgi:hypothetical protein
MTGSEINVSYIYFQTNIFAVLKKFLDVDNGVSSNRRYTVS